MSRLYEVVLSRVEKYQSKYRVWVVADDEDKAKGMVADGDWSVQEIIDKQLDDSAIVTVHNIRKTNFESATGGKL